MGKLRKKPDNIITLPDLAAADEALLEMGILNLEAEAIQAEAEIEIDKVKVFAAEQIAPKKARMKELELALEAFGKAHREEILPKGRKSLELNFGVLGFRKSTKIRIKKTTLALLKKLDLLPFIRLVESVNKEAMRDLPDDVLAQVDATREISEDFFFEVKREEIVKQTPSWSSKP